MYYFFKFINLFIFGCIGSLLCAGSERGYSSLRCAGFSLQWLLLLQSTGSRPVGFSSCGLRAPEHSLSSCGLVAPRHGMWDLPRPGTEPMSSALAGGFLTTVPPGKSLYMFYCLLTYYPTDGHLCCFQHFVMTDSAAVNNLVYILFQI